MFIVLGLNTQSYERFLCLGFISYYYFVLEPSSAEEKAIVHKHTLRSDVQIRNIRTLPSAEFV
jgi:hypothetical protein